MTDSKRHWYKGETGGVHSPLLDRNESSAAESPNPEKSAASASAAATGDEDFETSEEMPPTLPIADLLDALHVNPEEEASRTKKQFQEVRDDTARYKKEHEEREDQKHFGKCFTREVDLYPFQEQVLNFDNNEDPVENIRQFLRLLRGSNRAMSTYASQSCL